MEVAYLVLPVFAIIVTGWLAGWLGYISRSLTDGLVHFAYNIAMPAPLFVTIAQGRGDGLDHDDAVGRDAVGLALRAFSTRAVGELKQSDVRVSRIASLHPAIISAATDRRHPCRDI